MSLPARGKKRLAIFLATTPYGYENSFTALRLCQAALRRGYEVTVFATADGVYNFTVGQKARGIPNAGKEFSELLGNGLCVELCGSCLQFRGLEGDEILWGAEPSSLKNLFKVVDESQVFITLGS